MGLSRADNSVKTWRKLAISNPKPDLHNINAHTKFVKIHWCLLKLSSGNENMGVYWADNSVKNWRNLPISNPKSDLHNINAHTKFGENPLMLTQVIIWKQKTDGRRTDWLRDNQCETIISSHYCVAGYKKSFKMYICWPFWISDSNNLSYFRSSSHPNASYQVSSQMAFQFRRWSEK